MNSKLLACALMAACLHVAGCEESALPPGTVASVNGEPISLHSVQALLDSRSAALGIPPRPSMREMQENYRQALAILIAHTLVRQELAERGMAVSEQELNEAISQIREDFGEEGLEAFLAETSLREDEWQQLVRDHLSLQAFTERQLLPSIKISLPEIRAWYEAHAEEFSLPETAYVCYAIADNREALEAWCKGVGASGFVPGPMAQCMTVATKDGPEPWNIKKIKPGNCGQIVQQEEQWRTVAVLEKDSEGTPRLSEIYGLVENILLAEKKQTAFDEWLAKKMAGARILGSPELFPPAPKTE